jgi:serine/threonine protein kinase
MAMSTMNSKLPTGIHRTSSASTKDGIVEIRNASQESLLATAALVVENKIAGSCVFDSTAEARIPRFEMHEMRLGRILGRGGFCVVTNIETVRIQGIRSGGSSDGSNSFMSRFGKRSPKIDGPEPEVVSNPGSDLSSPNGEKIVGSKGSSRSTLSRISIAKLAKKRSRKGGRFALKQVLPEMERSDKITYLKGIVDLAIEAKFLSALDHPHIIALIGISKAGPSDFIIVERLKETLSMRFKTWMNIDRQCKGITGVFTGSKRKEAELYESRISVAYDVASATEYLHSRDIIFRDLVSFFVTVFLLCHYRG